MLQKPSKILAREWCSELNSQVEPKRPLPREVPLSTLTRFLLYLRRAGQKQQRPQDQQRELSTPTAPRRPYRPRVHVASKQRRFPPQFVSAPGGPGGGEARPKARSPSSSSSLGSNLSSPPSSCRLSPLWVAGRKRSTPAERGKLFGSTLPAPSIGCSKRDPRGSWHLNCSPSPPKNPSRPLFRL